MKKLTYKKFIEILKDNNRENPFDISDYDLDSIIRNRLKIYSHSNFIVRFLCKECNKETIKNIHRWDRANKLFLTLCGPCLLKYNYNEKHGVTNPNKLKSVRNKISKTNLERYGVENPGQRDCQKKAISKANKENSLERKEKYHRFYEFNGMGFDSSWELVFYIYHKDKKHKIIREPCFFEYFDHNNVSHYYIPDFKVGNRYYEIKGEQFIERYKNGKIKTLKDNKAKYNCMCKHNVIIIDKYKIKKYFSYVTKTYGEDYLDKFKIKTDKNSLE